MDGNTKFAQKSTPLTRGRQGNQGNYCWKKIDQSQQRRATTECSPKLRKRTSDKSEESDIDRQSQVPCAGVTSWMKRTRVHQPKDVDLGTQREFVSLLCAVFGGRDRKRYDRGNKGDLEGESRWCVSVGTRQKS